MRARAGSIVNIASLAGQTGNPGQINYAASKAALIAMTKSLSMEVGSRGIRVNAVSPGLIETEMLSGIPQPHLDDLEKADRSVESGMRMKSRGRFHFCVLPMPATLRGIP